MKRRRLWIILGVLLVVAVALGAGGWVYHEQPRFCATCHIMQPYLDSWNGEDTLAGAHADAEVDCLQCHEPTIQEQVAELTAFITNDYETPLEEREFDDEWCLRCHEHGTVEEIAALTADLDPNPHEESHYVDLECNTCHNVHRESEYVCAQCHEPPVTSTAWVTPTETVDWFDPAMDCTVCHLMVPYVESLEDPMLLAYDHAQEGLACIDCHEPGELEEGHVALDATATRVSPRQVDSDFCLDCHVSNEHSSWEELIGRTADYTYNDEAANPHDPHGEYAETGEAEFECSTCHDVHAESKLIGYCWSCHHEMTFENCDDCHGVE